MASQDSFTVVEEIAETTTTHGISILKEIFPNHGSEEKIVAKEATPGQLPLQQLLASIPTPARATAPHSCTLTSTVPPTVSSGPVVPPPPPGAPPMLPAATCYSRHDQLQLSRMMSPPLPEPTFTSYRERLRTSGRHAFQRAYDVGLLPKAMKQDVTFTRMDSQYQPDMRTFTPMSTPLSYMSNGGHTPVSMHSNECWPVQMDPSPMAASFPSQQMHMLAQQLEASQMPQMQLPQVLSYPNLQHQQQTQALLEAPSPHVSQMQLPQMLSYPNLQHQQQTQAHMEAPSPHVSQMQVGMHMSQLQPQPMQLPQMQMPQMQPPQTNLPVAVGGDATPIFEFDRCMSLVMPGATQFPYDKDMMAAQLQATADCQCYED